MMNDNYSFAQLFFGWCDIQNITVLLARPLFEPEHFVDSDLDIFIQRKSLPVILDWIRNQDYRITSYYKRSDGMSVYLYGIGEEKTSSIHIDFCFEFSLKGIPYLNIHEVLQKQIRYKGISYPDPVDQLLILTMLHGIKHQQADWTTKYRQFIEAVLKQNPLSVQDHLIWILGEEGGLRAYEEINRQSAFSAKLIWPFYLKSWQRYGLKFFYNLFVYHIKEAYLRFLRPKDIIAILGVDGAGKTTFANELMDKLHSIVPQVHYRHCLPLNPLTNPQAVQLTNVMPHEKPARDPITSHFKLVFYLAASWMAYFKTQRTAELYLYDRYIYDVLVDHKRFRHGTINAFTRFLIKLFPEPLVTFLLTVSGNTAQRRKQEVSPQETGRQLQAYKNLDQAVDGLLNLNGELNTQTNVTIAFDVLTRLLHATNIRRIKK